MLKLNKKNMKTLSHDNQVLPQQVTQRVAGGLPTKEKDTRSDVHTSIRAAGTDFGGNSRASDCCFASIR
ncbi:hypothetical protein HG263_03300 [Pseudoalteromonas sp. JBTF-M23]|uniref:Uncharacterized protein n=1 Tax=Pseudoalteromonas caenipelagi TaxID=2726988 RepID=A0A849VCT4_9GAMM|nr:hypothetical protein [Pseudoalteromonas caenipelagi]NOU49567.1 hypothetical protein [Pseudoalteromonas caenipelagi]